MPVTLDWDNPEKTILRLTLADGWAWEDLKVVSPVAIALMGSVDHTVHVLVDHTKTHDLARGGPTHALELMRILPPNFGIVVVVAEPVGIRKVLNAVGILTGTSLGRRIAGVATFEEAYRRFAAYKTQAG